MKISEAILKCLKQYEVECVFGIPAGTVSPIYDSLNDVDIKPVIMKNEAGAAYSAARYASLSKKLGVCIVAGGVGINNMVNGIADAMRDKVPTLFISGFVHRWQFGKGAIQEIDTQEIFRPITKYSKTIFEEDKTIPELIKAIELALTPPYGPVHISIPIDIQSSFIDEIPVIDNKSVYSAPKPNYSMLDEAIEIVNSEEEGIILAGKGCRGFTGQLIELSEKLQWPIITTTQGKGVIPTNFNLCLGSYGFAGTDAADMYVEDGPATCVLILGSSLGESATCNFNNKLVNNRKVIHIDWDKKTLGKVFETDAGICCDLKDAFPYLIDNVKESPVYFEKPILNMPYEKNHTGVSLQVLFESLHTMMPSNTCYVSDLGEFMGFIFKYLTIQDGGEMEINLNYGAMGSGVGGAVGAYMADPSRPTVAICGDGSFFMNGMEILTAKEYKMPIVYVVVNNAMLGLVEHGHQFLFGRVVKGFQSNRVSIHKMAESLGIKTMQIVKQEDTGNIPDFISDLNGPCIIEVVTDGSEDAPNKGRLKALQAKNNT